MTMALNEVVSVHTDLPASEQMSRLRLARPKVDGWHGKQDNPQSSQQGSEYPISRVKQLVDFRDFSTGASHILQLAVWRPFNWDQVILQTWDDGYWGANCRMQNEARWLLVQEIHCLHFWFPSRSGTGHIHSLQGSHVRQLRHNHLASAMTSIIAEVCKPVHHLACLFKVFCFVIILAANPNRKWSLKSELKFLASTPPPA